jgi:2-keto-3-deoxy-L-rhamnonate aldolase RhmA
VPNNQPSTILRYLDLGSSGILAPHIGSVDDARTAVAAAKYGPAGQRSYGGPRAQLVSRAGAAEYVALANRETLVVGLFEDAAGIDQIDQIFAVEGLDALAVGPNDLAFSMGLAAQPWHPEVQRVVDRVIEASRRAGKATGLPAGDLEQARSHLARGCRIVSVGVGALLTPSAKAFMGAIGG